MVKELNFSDVRKELSRLLDEVERTHEEIIVKRRGRRIAKITPYGKGERDRYPLRGLGVWMSEDFDEPMPELWQKLAN